MNKPKHTFPISPVVASDHPDLRDAIVWSEREIKWINEYADRCFNQGVAKGMEAGAILFKESDAISEIAMLVKRMALVMRKQSEQAMDYINRMGLEGSPMREDK